MVDAGSYRAGDRAQFMLEIQIHAGYRSRLRRFCRFQRGAATPAAQRRVCHFVDIGMLGQQSEDYRPTRSGEAEKYRSVYPTERVVIEADSRLPGVGGAEKSAPGDS